MSLFSYIAPQSLEEALAILSSHPKPRPLAGGHSELLRVNRNRIANALLVDLRKIEALDGIEHNGQSLRIGAMTTLDSLARNTTVQQQLPILGETALIMGDAQLRNRATVGGNLAAREVGADLPALLAAMDASIHISSQGRSREISVEEFLSSEPEAALGRGELIQAVTVPLPGKNSGVAYEKLKHPATLFALCGIAAAVVLTSNKSVNKIRIALTGATDRVSRLKSVEEALVNKTLNGNIGSITPRIFDDGPDFRSDHFASAEYRRHLAQVLTDRALQRAIARASA
jgi:carbon-monoxide dehydrogenase medium subunit